MMNFVIANLMLNVSLLYTPDFVYTNHPKINQTNAKNNPDGAHLDV